MATPPFLIEPTFEGEQEVVPFHESRRLTDPVAAARNSVLSEFNFDAATNLRQIAWAAEILERGTEPVREHTGVVTEVPIGRERGNHIAKAAELRCRILNKVMPDIRPVVIADQRDEQVFDFKQILSAVKETPLDEDQSSRGADISTED